VQALADFRTQTFQRPLPRLLKGRPYREDREERKRVRRRVDEERQGPTKAEQRSAERWPAELDGRDAGATDADRCGELPGRYDRAERALLRRKEERGTAPSTKPTIGICQNATRPARIATAKAPSVSARTESAASIRRFRFQRSAATPARRPKSACGSSRAKPTRPALVGE